MSAKPEVHGPRFFAWLYSRPSQQPALAALFGIEREVSASLRPDVDHHVAHTRLEWWRAECERYAAGHPSHPLTRQLQTQMAALEPGGTPDHSALAGLAGLVDGAVWDLAGATFERRAELTAYCRRWAAAMIAPLAPLAADTGSPGAGSHGAAAEVDWLELGAALREIELLGDLAREARCGRLRLPLDELERAAVTPQTLAAPPWPLALAAMLRGRHRALQRQLAAAVSRLPPMRQPGARGILVWTALARQASLRAERALPQPPAESIAGAAAANWRAWRAARAAGAGNFRIR